MTDFSPRLDEPSDVPPAAAAALISMNDDIEIIEAVTNALYPEWRPLADGFPDRRLENGRDTWHGIVAEIAGTRSP